MRTREAQNVKEVAAGFIGDSADHDALMDHLRGEVSAGRASVAILEHWRSLDGWLNETPEALTDLLTAAADIEPSLGSARTAAVKSVGVALVGSKGQLRTADERFLAWIGDPGASLACMRLVRRAVEGQSGVGLVETLSHGVITVFAAGGRAIDKWREAAALDPDSARGGPVAAALIAFAPSRSEEAIAQATRAFGLSALEGRLTAALLDAPTLELAAAKLGVGRETAKEALAGAMRKVGVTGAAQLVGRVLKLSCPDPDQPLGSVAEIGAALGLSPTEARVACELGRGLSAKDAGKALQLSPQTVATYRRSIFAKTGVNRVRDLGRLLAEVEGLERLASGSEVVLSVPDARERLRVMMDADGRRVAFIDYGPASGQPVILGHAATTGRTCPPPLLARLQAAGWRVIALQRPGFGLTQTACRDYLTTATADLVLLLDEIGVERADLLTRSSLTGLELAARRPERLNRLITVNPQPPRSDRRSNTPLALATRMLLEQPALIEPFARMLTRQSRSDLIAALARKAAAETVADQAVVADPVWLNHLVRDAQGLLGPDIAGFIAEQQLLASGWAPPASVTGAGVTVVQGGALSTRPALAAWPSLSEARFVTVPEGGWFLQFSHPEVFVDLLGQI